MIVASQCTTDVVLDTNVLSHADNAGAPQHESALRVLEWMSGCDVLWILDDQGKSAPDPATSVLYSEYRRTLAPQGYAITLFIACLGSNRIRFARRPDRPIRESVKRLVPRNTRDQAVLGAAHGSTDRVLVSNDMRDFSPRVREDTKHELSVMILDSDEAVS